MFLTFSNTSDSHLKWPKLHSPEHKLKNSQPVDVRNVKTEPVTVFYCIL